MPQAHAKVGQRMQWPQHFRPLVNAASCQNNRPPHEQRTHAVCLNARFHLKRPPPLMMAGHPWSRHWGGRTGRRTRGSHRPTDPKRVTLSHQSCDGLPQGIMGSTILRAPLCTLVAIELRDQDEALVLPDAAGKFFCTVLVPHSRTSNGTITYFVESERKAEHSSNFFKSVAQVLRLSSGSSCSCKNRFSNRWVNDRADHRST